MRVSIRTASSTGEQLLCAGPCYVWGVRPELTTTGTLTLRNASVADGSGTTKVACAIGLTQAGKDLDGALFDKGLTIQQSVGTDQCHVTWEAR